jgi:hypothetical protein
MAKSNFSGLTYKAKNSIVDIFKSIKWEFIVTTIILLIGFFVGVYFCFSSLTQDLLGENLAVNFLTGNMSSFISIIYRILSTLVVMLLLFMFSKSKWLIPFAVMLIFYRAYLLGINIGIMLKFYGISGIFVGIIFIFPIQLVTLFLLTFFFWALFKGGKLCLIQSPLKFCFVFIGGVVLLNLALALLLILFSPNVILVL